MARPHEQPQPSAASGSPNFCPTQISQIASSHSAADAAALPATHTHWPAHDTLPHTNAIARGRAAQGAAQRRSTAGREAPGDRRCADCKPVAARSAVAGRRRPQKATAGRHGQGVTYATPRAGAAGHQGRAGEDAPVFKAFKRKQRVKMPKKMTQLSFFQACVVFVVPDPSAGSDAVLLGSFQWP